MTRPVIKTAERYFSTRRLEALTDGVFAIAMTLLVLDLDISGFGGMANSQALYEALLTLDLTFTSFAISFLLLGSMWAVHMRQFEYIRQADRHMVMINTIRLFFVVLIPLTTSVIGSYSHLALGRVLLPLNFMVLALISFIHWRYVLRRPEYLDEHIPDEVRTNTAGRAIVLLSVPVTVTAIWVGAWAFLLFLFGPLVSRVLHAYRV